jgi:protein-tyrosine phosphatase
LEAYPIDWPNCRNARDLAGIAVDGGRWIRPGALIRSDNLVLLDERGLAAIRSAGVSRIVDVRSVWECRTFPSPLADDPAWVNVPLTDVADPDESALDLAVQYCYLLDRKQTRLGEAIVAIADAPPGCVVVTCHAGKDRTGLVIAVALAGVGVSDEAIGADYATLGPGPLLSMLIGSPFLAGSSVPEMMPPQPATIVMALDHLRSRYGSVATYLTGAGVTGRQLQSLTGRLCTS